MARVIPKLVVAALPAAWLVAVPAGAVDTTPRCAALRLEAAAQAVVRMSRCHERGLGRPSPRARACVDRAVERFLAARDRVARQWLCRADDGTVRVRAALAEVVEGTVSRLATPAGGARCRARKLRAAAKRAQTTLVAMAGTIDSPDPLARRKRRRLAARVAAARREFAARLAALDASGRCASTGDAAAIGGAVDAALDGLAGALDLVVRSTVVRASPVAPPHTPGSPGVSVTNPKLATQFGDAALSLNNVTYTRWQLAGQRRSAEAILILVPGFGGGAGNFEVLAENLITRMLEDRGMQVEVWGYDRRTEQLEDRAGALLAARLEDPLVALDWYYGAELGFTLHPALAAGPGRRAVFYNKSDDVPFIAAWTSLVHSRDIDAVVEAARALSTDNVFLGGHSAGTGFAARYAATDLNVSGSGTPDPGYAKLRGLVLLEGGGGRTDTPPLSDDALDRIIAKHDGGLFGAVRDAAPRCVDGVTACTIATEAADCAGLVPPACTPDAPAHGVILGISPRILAAAEPAGVQGLVDPDAGQVILQGDHGGSGNNAIARVPDLALLGFLPPGTVDGLFGSFLDDDGVTAAAAPAFAGSVGAPGPVVNGLVTWLGLSARAAFPSCPGTMCQTPDNGPPPTVLPASGTGFWGREKEVVRLDRLRRSFVGVDGANASDWYYPLSGLGVTTAPGLCAGGVCAAGALGASCDDDGDCAQSISLDSSPLSIGRGRPDIENLTQAAGIDVPVLCVGGSNGLTSVPARYLPFARSVGVCATPTCDGTPRIVAAASPSEAFPAFGAVAGGFEVVIAEGFAHMDVVAAEDDADNPIVPALAAFIARNVRAAPGAP